MGEHLTQEQTELYRRRDGSSRNRQLTAAHLAACQACRERVLDSGHSVLAIDALTEAFLPSVGEEPFHLSHDELKSYVAGSSGRADQVICESHIELCNQCARELRLLSATESARKFDRPGSPWRFLAPARLAAAFALIGVLALAALIWWKQSSRPTQQESVSNSAKLPPGAAVPHGSVAESTPPAVIESIAPNPLVLASLKDNNREVRLDQEGKLTGLEGFEESSQKMVKSVLAGERLTKPNVLDELSSPPIKLLGEAPVEHSFEIISPAGKVITEEQPTLRWRPLVGAKSYVVSLFDNNFNRVALSPALSGTNWSVNVPLPRGQSYSWEVVATKDGKEITAPVAPAPRAQFKLLEADKLSALSKVKQQKPVSHLALGLMYAHFGLVSEAEGEFRKLVRENPDSALAKQLLRTVQAWARQE